LRKGAPDFATSDEPQLAPENRKVRAREDLSRTKRFLAGPGVLSASRSVGGRFKIFAELQGPRSCAV
jgi:hypothetical protein